MFLKDSIILDLTHPLSPLAPTWDGSCGFCQEIAQDHAQQGLRTHKITMQGGIGTHMDAPLHFIPEGASITDIACEKFLAPACVLNIAAKAHAEYSISRKDVEEYEARYGTIPEGALVIGFTGWSRFWTDSTAYRNLDREGKMHFPTFSPPAIELLLQREIVGIAIDTLSPDVDPTFPVHKMLLGAGKYIIENIADCSKMPASGGRLLCLPMKCEAAAEAPVRILGVVQKEF